MLDFSVTFFITIINITVLCIILRVILFKPVTKFMSDRARRIRDSIEQSENDRAQADELLTQYKAQLKDARTEADTIIRNAREYAGAEAERIIAESRASAEQVLDNARKQIETEHKAALAVFRQEASALVIAASGRLVGREITNEDNRQYADLFLHEVSLPGDDSQLGEAVKS